MVGDVGQSADAVAAFTDNFKAADASTAAGQSSSPKNTATDSDNAPTRAADQSKTINIPDDVAISPKAKELAQQRTIDVITVNGSGPKGRITAQDIEQASLPAATAIGSGQPVNIEVNTDGLDVFYASPLAKRLAQINNVDLSCCLLYTSPSPRDS